jgi:hypothetical protein
MKLKEQALQLNPRIAGYVVICFKELREVSIMELREGFNKDFDASVEFYSRVIGKCLFTHDFDFARYDRAKKLRSFYREYEIFYSTEIDKFLEEKLRSEFDFVVIIKSENIVTSFEIYKKRFKDSCFHIGVCRKNRIDEIVGKYRSKELRKEE